MTPGVPDSSLTNKKNDDCNAAVMQFTQSVRASVLASVFLLAAFLYISIFKSSD